MERTERNVSEKEIYLWNMIGSVLNVVASVFFLLAVTRLTGSRHSDAFNLGWSVAYLMMTIGAFAVRIFQATDVTEQYRFRQYVIFRFLTILALTAASVLYVLQKGYTGVTAGATLLLCAYNATEALSDVFQGRFHQKERLDLAGKAMSARIVACVVGFAAALLVSHNVIHACITINVIAFVSIFLFDLRYLHRARLTDPEKSESGLRWIPRLMMQCLPLFLNSFLIQVIFNEPKAAIESAISNGSLADGAQTVYSVLFMPSLALNLLILVLYPTITKMAILWSSGDSKGYLNLLAKIVGVLTGLSVVILGAAYLIGIPALALVFGIDLDGTKTVFMLLLAGGCSNALMNVFANAVTVIRKHYALLPAYLITAAAVLLLTQRTVRADGLLGAGKVFLLSQVALLVMIALVFWLLRPRENNTLR